MFTKRNLFFVTFTLALLLFTLVTVPKALFSQTRVESIDGSIKEIPRLDASSTNRSVQSAQEAPRYNPFTSGEFPYEHPSLITQAIALAAMSLAPFIFMLLTSFAKISIVLSLLRNALGTQQAPPNQVVNGISLMITLFIMFPTGYKMYQATEPLMSQAPTSIISGEAAAFTVRVMEAAKEPFKDFLNRNSSIGHKQRFYQMAYRIAPEEFRDSLKLDDMIILIPSFVTTQLKGAFEIGVLIYLPFFVIDLVTSNILLAMGMMMLSPVTIALPLKIFLLVMMDAWTLLITGLVQTFR
jgi:type III secretion protein R